MNRSTSKPNRALRTASLTIALASFAALLGGCTIYASGTDEWDSDHPSSSARDGSHPPPPRSVVPVSLIGREVQVYFREEGPVGATGRPDQWMRGRLRDAGDWVRLDRDDGSTVLIPRESIRHIEPVPPSTTQP